MATYSVGSCSNLTTGIPNAVRQPNDTKLCPLSNYHLGEDVSVWQIFLQVRKLCQKIVVDIQPRNIWQNLECVDRRNVVSVKNQVNNINMYVRLHNRD